MHTRQSPAKAGDCGYAGTFAASKKKKKAMGIIKCPIHGRQGFYEMCEHIWENLENEIISEMKELPVLHTKICHDCFANNNVEELGKVTFEDILELPEEEQIRFEEKVGSKYDNLNRKVKCIECLNQIRLIVAKRKGEDFPFEPFENTLMFKDNKKIEELREILTSNYKFQKFQNPYIKNQDALFISSGGITYPFSIKFYYVTTQEDQNKLLKLIDDFFEEIPQKQRKISFYEAENWITEEKGNKIHEYRGEEKLLLEKIVK